MTLRESLRRLLGKPTAQPLAGPDRADYSYRVFWTKQAGRWDAERRRAVLATARAVAASDEFEPNLFERRYRIEGVDGEHSGASLLALIRVLEAVEGQK
ncbi:MAG TPA: hypothetical protein VJG32_18260 [Anaerolineae bacterium]|nr:hypothetical protein [Anaerolineae bacterium]